MADSPYEQRTPVQTHENNQTQDGIHQTQEDDQAQDTVQTHDSRDNRSESSEESDSAQLCVEKRSPVGNDACPSGTDMLPPSPPIDEKKWPMDDKCMPMDDMKKPPIDAGIAIPPPPPPVDEESQQSFPREPPYWRRLIKNKTFQMIAAALLAITIGLVVAATVEKVPDEAKAFLALPGYMWLRAVKAAVVPLIITSLILAVQRLKHMSGRGASIAKWTLGYYMCFMIIAIVQGTVIGALGCTQLFVAMSPEAMAEAGEIEASSPEPIEIPAKTPPYQVIVQTFENMVPDNIVDALASDERLLSVMVMALAAGYLLRPTSMFIKVTKEVEELVDSAISFLIRVAPIGIFFLILPNLFVLPIRQIGRNVGVLIGTCLAGMCVHLFITSSLVYLFVVRENPYAFWLRIAPAWMEAWGSGSSATTLPVTMECVQKQNVPVMVSKFVVPLGVLINMDGTALYFPIAVCFMAVTQGITLGFGEYVIVGLLSTLATLGASPIPGSALVFVVMICDAVHVPVSSMYAVIVAIDWFIDRFRIAFSASGDAFAAKIIASVTGWKDGDEIPYPVDVKEVDDDNASTMSTVVSEEQNYYWYSQETHGVTRARSLWD